MTNVNGEALRAIREKDGLLQRELGEKAGISMQYVCDIEKGRRGARPDVLKRLAHALGVPQSAILAQPEREVAS